MLPWFAGSCPPAVREPSESRWGYLGSALVAAGFSLGCLTCFGGAIIATLLIYVGSIGSAAVGAAIMLAFSLGIAIPFLLAATFLSRTLPVLSRIQAFAPQIGFVSMLVIVAFRPDTDHRPVPRTERFHISVPGPELMRRCSVIALTLALAILPATSMARFDDGARYAFVASPSEKSVFIIDLVEQETASLIPVAERPDAVAAIRLPECLGHLSSRQQATDPGRPHVRRIERLWTTRSIFVPTWSRSALSVRRLPFSIARIARTAGACFAPEQGAR